MMTTAAPQTSIAAGASLSSSGHSRASRKTETLPVGVARVPQWWMDETPHYTLDLDDQAAQRHAQAELDLYYQQIAALSDAGLLGPDGQILIGPDGQLGGGSAGSYNNGWAGRSANGGPGGDGPGGPGGRNFQVRHVRIDPSLFGISESDPDYQAYLTGAKLPPGFLEKMREMQEKALLANNSHQTEFGRYGHQAEKQKFQPAWAKMKLRTTSTGSKIRHGQYNDSPNKHLQRRVKPIGGADPVDDPALPEGTAQQQLQVLPQTPLDVSSNVTADPTTGKKKRLVRKVRKVRKKKSGAAAADPEQAPPATGAAPTPPAAPVAAQTTPPSVVQAPTSTSGGVNKFALQPQPPVARSAPPPPPPAAPPVPAAPRQQHTSTPRSPLEALHQQLQQVRPPVPAAAAPPPPAAAPLRPAPMNQAPTPSYTAASRAAPVTPMAPVVPQQPPVSAAPLSPATYEEVVTEGEYEEEVVYDDDDEIIEEEYVDETEYEEELIDDELVEEDDMLDNDADDENLMDLQAQLAAKMAELARLQSQM